jgi:hypothetical protein
MISYLINTLGEFDWWRGGEGELILSNCARRSRSLSADVSELTRLFMKQDKFFNRLNIALTRTNGCHVLSMKHKRPLKKCNNKSLVN